MNRDEADERQWSRANPRLALRIGADGQIGDENAGESRSSGAIERIGARGDHGIEIAEEHERNAGASTLHELQEAIEGHSLLERALRARLNDRPVRHRIRERQPELDDVRTRLLQCAQQLGGFGDVGMPGGDVRNERAAARRSELGKATFDPVVHACNLR